MLVSIRSRIIDRIVIPKSRDGAGLLVLGIILLLFGSHFTAPDQMSKLGSPLLIWSALAAHLGGGIMVIIGIYRLYKSRRNS